MQPLPVWYLRNRTFLDMSQQATERARRQLLAHLGPLAAMSAFLPLLGDSGHQTRVTVGGGDPRGYQNGHPLCHELKLKPGRPPMKKR